MHRFVWSPSPPTPFQSASRDHVRSIVAYVDELKAILGLVRYIVANVEGSCFGDKMLSLRSPLGFGWGLGCSSSGPDSAFSTLHFCLPSHVWTQCWHFPLGLEGGESWKGRHFDLISLVITSKESLCHPYFSKCLFKLFAQTATKSQWLHLYFFPAEWVLKCLLKKRAQRDSESHWLHLYDFLPDWVFKCLKLEARQLQSHNGYICAFFPRVSFYMVPQIEYLSSSKVALATFILSISRMTSQMSLQIACLNSGIICTGSICAIFLRSGFSHVSSNGVYKLIHNHIGCICKAFLQSEFSNVSSKHVH